MSKSKDFVLINYNYNFTFSPTVKNDNYIIMSSLASLKMPVERREKDAAGVEAKTKKSRKRAEGAKES